MNVVIKKDIQMEVNEVKYGFKRYRPESLTLNIPTQECCKPTTQTKEQNMREQNMNVNISTDNSTSENDNKRSYLSSRAYDAKYPIFDQLKKAFHLVDDDDPNSGQEFVDRILAGKYVIEPYNCYGNKSTRIRWRDPNVAEDQHGFKAACDKLDAAFKSLQDDIQIKDPPDALVSLQAFEKMTFH